MCVDSVYKYFRNFRKSVKCATMKIRIAIEKHRSLKLRLTRQAFVSFRLASSSIDTKYEVQRPLPDILLGVG